MDSEPFMTALKAAIDRLRQLASEDAQLRTQLRRMAEAIFEITDIPDQPAGAVQQPVAREPPVVHVAAERVSPVETEERVPAPAPAVAPDAHLSAPPPIVLPEQTLGQAEPAVDPALVTYPARWRKTTDCAFSLIEARCRLKAEGARWAVTRRRLVAEGANFRTEIEPKEQDIISRAGSLEDCLLWMCQLSGTSLNRYEEVARCFDVVADILSVVKQAQDEPEFERSLDLLAEAQSVLRVVIAAIDGPTDTDQVLVCNWLETAAIDRQMFAQRYKRIDDPADRSQSADLASRIEALHCEARAMRRRAEEHRKSAATA
jgi:hypothetical protein